MARKQRLTVSLDPEVVEAVRRAADLDGLTVSKWLNKLLAEKTGADEAIRERNRLELLAILEKERPGVTPEQLQAAWDEAMATAIVVNGHKAQSA